jgi:hypothetical protein
MVQWQHGALTGRLVYRRTYLGSSELTDPGSIPDRGNMFSLWLRVVSCLYFIESCVYFMYVNASLMVLHDIVIATSHQDIIKN